MVTELVILGGLAAAVYLVNKKKNKSLPDKIQVGTPPGWKPEDTYGIRGGVRPHPQPHRPKLSKKDNLAALLAAKKAAQIIEELKRAAIAEAERIRLRDEAATRAAAATAAAAAAAAALAEVHRQNAIAADYASTPGSYAEAQKQIQSTTVAPTANANAVKDAVRSAKNVFGRAYYESKLKTTIWLRDTAQNQFNSKPVGWVGQRNALQTKIDKYNATIADINIRLERGY